MAAIAQNENAKSKAFRFVQINRALALRDFLLRGRGTLLIRGKIKLRQRHQWLGQPEIHQKQNARESLPLLGDAGTWPAAAARTMTGRTTARRAVLRRRMDSRRLSSTTRRTRTGRPRSWRTMMWRARRMNARRLRPWWTDSRRPRPRWRADMRRPMMRRTRQDNRRTINRRPQMMMAARHNDRHRQHDRRRARQPFQIIFRHPARGAGVIDLAPALRAAFDLDRGIPRQRRDHRIVGARPFAQIDV
jgi:hypothetical protein